MTTFIAESAASATATAVATEPLCAECLSHQGLCLAHAKSVLPQLAQPHWYRLIGTTTLASERALKEESSAALKAKRRTARRLQRAMAGQFTRNTRAKVA